MRFPPRVTVLNLVLALALLLSTPVLGTLALVNAQDSNGSNAFSATSLYSPTGLGAAVSTSAASTALSWTASSPHNGNGYAVSAVDNGTSSACPAGAASYTTFLGGATSTSYTDTSSLQDGTARHYLCYLVQDGFKPAGGPPWAALPTWTSVNSLTTIAAQLPDDTFSFGSTCNGAACSAGWYTVNVTVVLSPAITSPRTSSVTQIAYSVDGGATTTVNATTATLPALSTDGTHTVSYTVTSSRGTTSATQTLTVKVDKTAPTISAWAVCDQDGNPVFPAAKNWIHQGGSYIVYATVTDATSGVAGVTANIGIITQAPFGTPTLTSTSGTCAGTTYTYTSAAQTAAATLFAGSNLLYADIVATDNAGNVAHSNSSDTGDFSADNTAPTSASSLATVGGSAGTGQLVVYWTAGTDAASGVAGYHFQAFLRSTGAQVGATIAAQTSGTCTNGTASHAAPCAVFTGTSGTRYNFSATTVDNAGNLGTAGSVTNVRAP